jgi:3-dehydroquinate synthetase
VELHYSTNIFQTNNHDLADIGESERKVVVVDKNVYELYKDDLNSYFKNNKISNKLLVVDSSESTKTFDNADNVIKFFEDIKILRRSEPVIAIGGGVLLDLVGFCCGIYRRGIPYVKIPTTLLALVDASVGAKVAVNHLNRRNRIGMYYPASLTLLDKSFIKTQNDRDIINGIAEIFKLAIIKSEELFKLLEQNAEQLIKDKFQYGAIPVRVINLAISDMIDELSPNLWEKKLDRCVDFGHSFSPFVEMKNIPDLQHGEAVALDCIFSSCISFNRGYISKADLNRIFETARKLGLQTYHVDFLDFDLLKSGLNDTTKA